MKRTTLVLMSMIFLIVLLKSCSAEMYLWQQTTIDNASQTVTQEAIFQLLDEGNSKFLNVQYPVPIDIITAVQNMPYNISQYYPQYPNAYVDWCNATIVFQQNIYDNNLAIVNTTNIYQSYNYTNTNATYNETILYMRINDGANVEFTCHYTNPDTLFINNTAFGQIQEYFPSYQCDNCSDFTFEEITDATKTIEAQNFKQETIYDKIQNLVEKDYTLWVYLSWFVKISFIIIAVGLVFAGLWYYYTLFKKIVDKV